jgi:hypothetical protein
VESLAALIRLDDFETFRVRLESKYAGRMSLLAALAEISNIIQLARSFGVERKILFRPTLCNNAEVSLHSLTCPSSGLA